MTITGQVGERFHLYDSPFGPEGHFAVILTRPDKNNEVLFVNFTETDPDGEFLIFFKPEELNFLKKKTTIAYGYGKKASLVWINSQGYSCPGIIPMKQIELIVYHAFESESMQIRYQKILEKYYPTIHSQFCTDHPDFSFFY